MCVGSLLISLNKCILQNEKCMSGWAHTLYYNAYMQVPNVVCDRNGRIAYD